jgi:hypothetical protein
VAPVDYLRFLLLPMAVYQAYVSFRVVRSGYYSTQQKAVQLLLIWLLPLFAAVLSHRILASMHKPIHGSDANFVRDDAVNPPGIGQ